MRKVFSIAILCLCGLSALLILLLIPMFVHIVSVDSEGWGSMMFGIGAVPLIVGNSVLLIAGVILYRKSSAKLDLSSVCVSGIILAVVVLAWLLVEPLRQSIIFGR